MKSDSIRDRIERMRSGGIDGPAPTGFIISEGVGGDVMLITHDLSLHTDDEVSIQLGDDFVRLISRGVVVLQTRDTDAETRETLKLASRLSVLEMNGSTPLRIHPARLY